MSVEAGEQLRTARLQKGLSVTDVAASLKVPARYVEALEGGDLSRLPEPAFVRGYMRGYARLVGLDPEALAALLAPVEIKAPRQQVGIAGMPVAVGRRSATSGNPLRRMIRHHRVAGVLLLVIAGGWVTWTAYEPGLVTLLSVDSVLVTEGVPATPVAAEVPLPTIPVGVGEALPVDVTLPAAEVAVSAAQVAAEAVTAPPPAPAVQNDIPRTGLYVRFRGDCWIEVRDADNAVIHHATGVAGNDLRLTGKEPLVVTLGNAGRADLWWNGDPVKVDVFSRAGVARVNLGRLTR